MEEKAELQQEKQVADNPVHESELKAKEPLKNVKDVGLDPIEDDLKSLSNLPSEFKRLQKEIIELWDVCNVSLVHRTYFFMLFKPNRLHLYGSGAQEAILPQGYVCSR
ncbi:hypothetical protein CsSME_00008113 [Camellia sinensis var. sinensis]